MERLMIMAGLALAALASVSASANPPARDAAPNSIVSRTIPVNGTVMSLHVSGAGEATIILEAGSGGDHRTWSVVQPLLSGLGRVVSYDRLDYGGSGRSARPRTATVIAEQLREALITAGIRPPYLLVGHSYGGALMRVFAARYPADVVGLVLVDPAQEQFYARASAEVPAAYLAQLEADLVNAEANGSEAMRREYLAYETSMMQARIASPPPGERIVLLSATGMELPAPLRTIWLEEQAAWARRAVARHVLVNSGHNIPRRNPASIVEAVRSLLAPGP